MTVVVDASVVIAGLVSTQNHGSWAEAQLAADGLVAPAHMPVEVASTLRFAELHRDISTEVATAAYRDLWRLPISFYPLDLGTERIWELRPNVTARDAWYIALAEWLDAPFATLDFRLTRASGPRCEFLTPESGGL